MKNKINWNSRQLDAIEKSGSTILVSAAAGSGKTAVLVERIIRKLTDKEHPLNIEDFLIVTFTRAAASQMKEKISNALADEIAEHPNDMHLRECRFKLPFANIGTIDSFCIGLIRENFNSLGITPDFTILDGSKHSLLKSAALAQVVEEFHTERAEEFASLNKIINDNKKDDKTGETIQRLYDLSTAHVFPDEWLNSISAAYNDPTPLSQTENARSLVEKYTGILEKLTAQCENCLEIIRADEKSVLKYEVKLQNDISVMGAVIEALKKGDWDETASAVNSASFMSDNTGPRNSDEEIKKKVKSVRQSCKETVKAMQEYFRYSSADYEKAKEIIGPAIKTLTDAVSRYSQILFELKRSENAYDFSDILHLTLKLLVKNENGRAVKTELACELSKNYAEIFVDEYQDVSAAQDMIFEALSDGDKNRFLVGDIKQSIYSFRQAMPEVFLALRDDTALHPDIERIYLNSNYRSRSEVTGTVNYIFEKIMTKENGDVDYDSREYLNFGAGYAPTDDVKIEFDFVNIGGKAEEKITNQAKFAAAKIKKEVGNIQLTEKFGTDGKDIMRPARYSDYAVLYRDKACGKIFSKVFEEEGIPFISDNEDTFLSSPEINFLKSLLRVIDNPTDDIAMAAVMLSPVFGFSPDDLAYIRASDSDRRDRFCKAVIKSADGGNEKAREFLDRLEKLRRISAVLPAGEFTARIIDETGFRALVSKMSNAAVRNANINSFINLANNYENSGIKGLSAFVRFISRIPEDDVKATAMPKGDSSDAVNLMTIHKSKGLEFPIVIIPNTEKSFSGRDLSENLIISKNCAPGMKYIEDNIRHKNLQWMFAKDKKRSERNSEHIRLLYVALTRAKERLTILASQGEGQLSLKSLTGVNSLTGRFDSHYVSGLDSFSKLMISALLSHPDAHLLRNASEIGYEYHDSCDTRIDFNLITEIEEAEKQEAEKTVFSSSPVIMEEIKKRLEYVYPYESLNRVRAKAVASKLGEKKFNKKYFASSKPDFARGDKLTGAQRGTATHKFMQYCDFLNASRDTQGEITRLKDSGILSEKEAISIDSEMISAFFRSDIYRRMSASSKIYREYQFTASLPVRDLYPETPEDAAGDEIIIIDGVADCAFEEDGKLVILDFKTDHADSADELIEEYANQLRTYKKCMAKVLGIEVKETLIYSFRLKTEIPVI